MSGSLHFLDLKLQQELRLERSNILSEQLLNIND